MTIKEGRTMGPSRVDNFNIFETLGVRPDGSVDEVAAAIDKMKKDNDALRLRVSLLCGQLGVPDNASDAEVSAVIFSLKNAAGTAACKSKHDNVSASAGFRAAPAARQELHVRACALADKDGISYAAAVERIAAKKTA